MFFCAVKGERHLFVTEGSVKNSSPVTASSSLCVPNLYFDTKDIYYPGQHSNSSVVKGEQRFRRADNVTEWP